MVSIVVVEPDYSHRASMLEFLNKIPGIQRCHGVDVASLFEPPESRSSFDLMVLSAPDVRARLDDTITVAQQHYDVQGIVLLSSSATLGYSIDDLAGRVYGYLCRPASQEALAVSIGLMASSLSSRQRNRRWYDKKQPSLVQTPSSQAGSTSSSILPDDLLQKNDTALTGPIHWPIDEVLKIREVRLLKLTPRQYDVLALLARGYPIKKISRILGISVSTSKTHVSGIYQRLGVNNRNAAVFSAVFRGATFGLGLSASGPEGP